MPILLTLRPEVTVDDVRTVLTAVTNHHDALRLRIVHRAGAWEQDIGDRVDSVDVPVRSLPDGLAPGSTQERDAVLAILKEDMGNRDLTSPPLTATYIHGLPGDQCHLAISVHGIVNDAASRDILLSDIFTAFGQRLAGQDIVLHPVTTSWREWSRRCAALATHPAVVESRGFWLKSATAAARPVFGSEIPERPTAADVMRLESSLTASETSEIDDARRRLRVTIEQILLAALSTTIANTVGDGTFAVDVEGQGRSVLRPDVDLRRTVGRFTTVYPVPLSCTADAATDARALLNDVHERLKAVPHYGIGYGLLRYLYAPTARLFGPGPAADVFFSYEGTIPDITALLSNDAPVQFDADTALIVREATAGLGHAVELRVYRTAGELRLDWWYDMRKVESGAMQALADGFSSSLLTLIRQAIAEDELESADDDLALVDLS